MRSFLIKILAIVVLFFVIEKVLWFVMEYQPQKEYDNRLKLVLDGEMNKDIIVFGSSKGAADVLASQLEKETGLSSYNLSYLGSDITYHDFVLETLLRYNKSPKKIILLIDTPFQFINEPSLKFRYDRLYPLTSYNWINNKLIANDKKSILSKYLFSLRVNTSFFYYKSEQIPQINPIDSHGSKPNINRNKRNLYTKLEFEKSTNSYHQNDELTYKINSFNNFKERCYKNNIELIYVIPPNLKTFNRMFLNRFKRVVDTNEKLYVYDTLNPIYKNKKYFHDSSHLYINGAKVFTSEISDFIKNESD